MVSNDAQSDAELITACRRGEEVAWDLLVARYQRLVYAIPRRYGLTPTEVEDVFQAVWMRLLQHLHRLEEPDRVSAWLVTTARRECWARRRGAGYERSYSVPGDELPEGIGMDEFGPEEEVIRHEQQRDLRRALDALDERCRQLLYLLYYDPDQPPYEQIAAELELAIGSIGPIRARCLKKLRRILQSL